jgi:hypothetical protein
MVLSVACNPDALLWLARLRRTDQYSYDHSLDVSAHVMIRALSWLGRRGGRDPRHGRHAAGCGQAAPAGAAAAQEGRAEPARIRDTPTHVDFSLQILAASPHATPQMLDIVGRHHERCDGSGYPHGLKGDAV